MALETNTRFLFESINRLSWDDRHNVGEQGQWDWVLGRINYFIWNATKKSIFFTSNYRIVQPKETARLSNVWIVVSLTTWLKVSSMETSAIRWVFWCSIEPLALHLNLKIHLQPTTCWFGRGTRTNVLFFSKALNSLVIYCRHLGTWIAWL